MRVVSRISPFARAVVKGVLWTAGGTVMLLLAYLAAAAVGTVWSSGGPARAAAAADDSVTIQVLSNGFHSDLVLPIEAGRPTAGLPISPDDLPGGLQGARYLIVGWGSQTAYTSLLALSDLTVEIAVKSLLFDRSVMHVQPYDRPLAGRGVYQLNLLPEQYARLIAFVAETFAVDDAGRAELIPDITQGFGDVFYRARPRFSLFYGCNAWTGQALREAGVPFGLWTPFAQSVEWNMERLAGR